MIWTWIRQYVVPDPRNTSVVWTTLAVLLVGLVIAGVAYLGASSPSPLDSQVRPAIPANKPDSLIHASATSGSQELAAEQSRPTAAELDAQLRQSENWRFSGRLKRLVEDTIELSNQSAENSKFIEELATNDTGRKIAADSLLTEKMIARLEIPDSRSQEILAIVEQASDLQKMFDKAINKSPAMGASKEATKQVEDLELAILGIRKELREAQAEIKRLANEASSRSPSAKTLEAAIKEHKSKQSARLAEAFRVEREITLKAKEELARETEVKMRELELQADRVKAEGDRKLKAAEISAAEIAATKAAEERLLQAEFDRDREQIIHYLHPLFMPGATQPGPDGWIRTLDSKPISLDALKSYRALHSLPEGPSALLLLFNHQSNDRKRGPYPGFNGGYLQDVHAEAIMPAYKLLLKYQHLLVKEKLLSP